MDQQSSALKVQEEKELLQGLSQSDMESSMPASQSQSVRWPALAIVCSLAAAGVVMMGSKGIAVADVAATVDLHSWDHYIDVIVQHSKGESDSAALVDLEHGSMWNTAGHPKALRMSPQEAHTVASTMKNNPDDFAPVGIMVGGKKYFYMKQCNGILTFQKKDQGFISLAKSDTAVVLAHTPAEADSRLSSLAVNTMAEYLTSLGMRRLMSGGDSAEYARRLQYDEDAADVVVDMDSSMIRAGFAGEDSPTMTEPPEADDFKLRMEQVYGKLEADASKQVVLISEAPLTSPESQKEWTQTLFDSLKVPGMCLANSAVLAAVAQGKTTAVVLYIANDAVYAVPVYETVSLDHATIHGPKEDNSAEKLAEMVYNSIMKTDVDIRKDLYANVVISGDATLAGSLKEELALLAPPTTRIKVSGGDGEGLAPWLGGSIWASLSDFRFITDKMYKENGPDVVLNTCF